MENKRELTNRDGNVHRMETYFELCDTVPCVVCQFQDQVRCDDVPPPNNKMSTENCVTKNLLELFTEVWAEETVYTKTLCITEYKVKRQRLLWGKKTLLAEKMKYWLSVDALKLEKLVF